jgi:hypothetical protein
MRRVTLLQPIANPCVAVAGIMSRACVGTSEASSIRLE